jgi:tetratricopeptide (TPR) repeat protein
MREPRINQASWLVAATAFVALAAWPAFSHLQTVSRADADPVMRLTPAPVKADFTYRDANVAFLESRYRRNAQDMIVPRMLSNEYLQRYRERGDVGDVLRARAAAQTSLAAMPRNNMAGDMALAGADLALHRFHEARSFIAAARRVQPDNTEFALSEASVDLELGDYEAARKLIDANVGKGAGAEDIIVSRWDEISGHVADAQQRLDHAMHFSDSLYDMPAERRAWYHFRNGELDYLRGDNEAAIAAERDALAIFPTDVVALNALARFELAEKRYAAAAESAKRAIALVPSPETLGILADAQTAQGERAGALTTRAEIDAEEKIGNAQHVNDRLIAVYLADHDLRPADAYAIARRELAVRDDIYAEDTLAWCAAKAGKWDVARAASMRALRFDTEDPRLQYHAGIIGQHFGASGEAARRFARALALNPHFSAVGSDDARARLASLKAPATETARSK